MVSGPACGYRSTSTLAVCATLLFVALTIAEALAALSLVGQIELLDAARFGASIPPAQAEARDARNRLLGIIELALALAALIALLLWVYRANRNARALGAQGMTYSPGWSVGWFFVPFANLVMPYLVVREIWKASTPDAGEHWRQARVSPLFGSWWALSVARGMMHYSWWPVVIGKLRLAEIASQLSLKGLWDFSWGLLIAEVTGIAVSVLTVVVIVTITGLQERLRALAVDREEPQFAAID
jgi:hypothetical protein